MTPTNNATNHRETRSEKRGKCADTDVMADVHRRHPPALEWMNSSRSEQASLPGLVVLELLDGCATKLEVKRLQALTDRFRTYWPSRTDNERARAAFADAKLAHGAGILDMLIAQTAIGLGARLLTFNAKHFSPVEGLTIQQPYVR